MSAGVLKTHGVSTLTIDEADDLLASNFRRDMARINEHCGKGVKGEEDHNLFGDP